MVRISIPYALWPLNDRQAWEAGHRRGGLLDDDGIAVDWADETNKLIITGYGCWLQYLDESGQLDINAHPGQRVSRPLVEDYIARLRSRNHSSTVHARILQLSRSLAVIAPAMKFPWLRVLLARLWAAATPARDDRPRLLPAQEVYDAGVKMIETASTDLKLEPLEAALQHRDGLMIAILSVCQVRAKNIAGMIIDKTLFLRGNVWWVQFEKQDIKNKRRYEKPLPSVFTPWITAYLERHRPLLMAQTRRVKTPGGMTSTNINAFWITAHGSPFTAKGIGACVSIATLKVLGEALNPHLFRKMVPTELSIHAPEQVNLAQAILNHSRYRMTEHYNLGRTIDASRKTGSLIQNLALEAEQTDTGKEWALPTAFEAQTLWKGDTP